LQKIKIMDFTGTYYRCNDCGHIFDYNDLCPNDSSENQEELNVREVKEWVKVATEQEQKRLEKMLESHGDL